MKRRTFIKNTALGTAAFSTLGVTACTNPVQKEHPKSMTQKLAKPLISLAQWSLNRAFFAKELDPNDFAAIASQTYDIHAIEYVNQFYLEQVNDEAFWQGLKKRADDNGVKSLLIMVDDEGDLGNIDEKTRHQAVENHYKWVNAAKLLDCHSIRVNAFGEGEKAAVRSALVDGMGRLCEYAAKENINILIENHGLYSSDGQWIAGIIKEINLPNMGTLPDFGNWCMSAKWGSTQDSTCKKVYDPYQGVLDFLPFAKGVSAKSYNFNEAGEDRIIDYQKMLKVVKDFGYDGYIGIEYEGEEKSEPEGIRMTKALIERVWEGLS